MTDFEEKYLEKLNNVNKILKNKNLNIKLNLKKNEDNYDINLCLADNKIVKVVASSDLNSIPLEYIRGIVDGLLLFKMQA